MPPLAETAAVVASEQVSATLWLLHLDAPHVAAQARPGQFVLARCADPEFPVADPYLPRAYFVFASDSQGSRLSVLVERRGSGSAWLCSRQPGHRLLVHGPAGREVRPARLTRNLLLLAEGTDAVAGLARLASDSSRRGLSVTLVENVPAGQEGVPARLLSPDVEYRTTSPEAGGLLGALPPLIRWADEAIVAASPDVLELLATLRRSHLEPFTLHAGVPVQAAPLAWLGGPDGWLRRGGDFLPCGAGWCGACAVSARTGRRLFCREGPVWPLEELRFAGHDAAQDDGAADATPVP